MKTKAYILITALALSVSLCSCKGNDEVSSSAAVTPAKTASVTSDTKTAASYVETSTTQTETTSINDTAEITSEYYSGESETNSPSEEITIPEETPFTSETTITSVSDYGLNLDENEWT